MVDRTIVYNVKLGLLYREMYMTEFVEPEESCTICVQVYRSVNVTPVRVLLMVMNGKSQAYSKRYSPNS